jgi:hypothetical protein
MYSKQRLPSGRYHIINWKRMIKLLTTYTEENKCTLYLIKCSYKKACIEATTDSSLLYITEFLYRMKRKLSRNLEHVIDYITKCVRYECFTASECSVPTSYHSTDSVDRLNKVFQLVAKSVANNRDSWMSVLVGTANLMWMKCAISYIFRSFA